MPRSTSRPVPPDRTRVAFPRDPLASTANCTAHRASLNRSDARSSSREDERPGHTIAKLRVDAASLPSVQEIHDKRQIEPDLRPLGAISRMLDPKDTSGPVAAGCEAAFLVYALILRPEAVAETGRKPDLASPPVYHGRDGRIVSTRSCVPDFPSTHPLVHCKLAALRSSTTGPAEFRGLVRSLAMLLAQEATADLPVDCGRRLDPPGHGRRPRAWPTRSGSCRSSARAGHGRRRARPDPRGAGLAHRPLPRRAHAAADGVLQQAALRQSGLARPGRRPDARDRRLGRCGPARSSRRRASPGSSSSR